jgi:hypothetical protein
MKFEPAPPGGAYARADEAGFRDLLKRFLAGVMRGDRDAELQPPARLILTDADGQRWAFGVDTSGNLTSEAL